MSFEGFWAKIWTIHGTGKHSGTVIKKDTRFRIEPIDVNGKVAYYRLNSSGGIDHHLLETNFYPLGWRQLAHEPLDPWQEGNGIPDKYQHEADTMANNGLDDPLVQRLEGTFTLPMEEKPIIARIYYFHAGEKGPKDWLVFDIITKHHEQEDGTAHADG